MQVAFLFFFIVLAISSLDAIADGSHHKKHHMKDNILVQGVPLVGSANGMFFDAQDNLYVANVLGQSISVLNPETGDILAKLGPEVGVFAPDDLTISPDGTLFWTDPAFGLVHGLSPIAGFIPVAAGFPSANPITYSDDGRLFFAQCFNLTGNGIFEADPTGITPPRTIRDGDPGCASNGMDWWDGALFSPRWFEERVVKVDIDTGDLTNITTGFPLGSPIFTPMPSGTLNSTPYTSLR